MKRMTLNLSVILFLIVIGVVIPYFNSIKKERPPKNILAGSTFGKRGTGLGEFIYPGSVAIKRNYFFVADSGNDCIQILKTNRGGSLFSVSSFGKEGKGLGEFNAPTALAIKENYLFVADSGNSRIQVFKINPDGSLVPKFIFGKKGKELGEFGVFSSGSGRLTFLCPLGLTIKENYLFVADSGNSRIQVLKINPDGSLSPEFSFGKEGKGLGEFGVSPLFASPIGLAIKENYLFVADSGNSRIQVLKINPDGSLSSKFSFGKEGKGLGEFGIVSNDLLGDIPTPFGLAIKENYLFVADSGNSRLQVFKINPDGSLSPKFSFGKEGEGLGEFKTPISLAIKNNLIYVADTGNSRIQVLEIKY